ncbi:Rpn family recombination-promoting nuclease/putative transposase [Cardinium endosymbiont of Culicoides punctatus]|uniref:Rpn family recombination-promoting nuclease/putative transposase n=1 Tax=Cardinium endosymbiont of Culicoides punctatus TaxID=2304601 RepID=UPI001058720A|nr:Rpn family recombination-promoting nuclease/putative transposase [Cardinium endosymbiont of Culicoides punctatus]TDG95436.1 hypothetical protein CCPUN_04120 [Cardinium endosymbiont of Culicoides punctatus]
MIKKYLIVCVSIVWMISQSCSTHRHKNYMDNQPSSTITTRSGRSYRNSTSSNEPPIRHRYARPTNDWCFKHIFGKVLSEDKNQNEFTRDLLNSLLRRSGDNEIKEVYFVDPNLQSESEEDHLYITDVHCVDYSGRKFIIEMQLCHHRGWKKRIQAYIGRDYSGQLFKGKKYYDLVPVYLLAITEFNMFKDHQRFISYHAYRDEENNKNYFKGTEIIVLELPKFNKAISEITDQKDRWAFLLKNAQSISNMSEEEKAPLISNPIIQRACQQIDQLNWSEEDIRQYQHAEDNRQVALASLEKAHNKGREEERTKNIQKNNERKRKIIKREVEKGLNKNKHIDDIKKKAKSVINSLFSDCSDIDDNMIDEEFDKQSKKLRTEQPEE